MICSEPTLLSDELLRSLQAARRPIFIWGAGIRPYAESARALAASLGIPVACTWGAIDLLHHDDPLMCGGFGTHGTRAANFAVQNSDLVLALGTRLDTKATGFPAHFARAARVAMVDIDRAEIEKFDTLGREIDFPICADAGAFIDALSNAAPPAGFSADGYAWAARIAQWKRRYADPQVDWPGVNPYQLMKELATWTTPDDVIVSDTGTALGYVMQGFPFKGERFLHAFNMTPMGYGLPAAVGACFATGCKQRVILITGDGSIMMSLSELATVARWNLPIKIILLDNQSHSMCMATERQWFGGRHAATTIESGLAFPKWQHVPNAFNIPSVGDLQSLFACDTHGLLRVLVDPQASLVPQAKYGQPIEDADPQLPREEFLQQMIIAPLETA